MYIGVTGLYIHYLQLELSGKLAGNFDLLAIAPVASHHTTIVYKKTGQDAPEFLDATSAFRPTLSSFTNSAQFDASNNIFPDFPEDLQVLVKFTVGTVHLSAYMALAVDVEVEGSNSFKAQAGAFAHAQTKVALFVFEKIKDTPLFSDPTGTCTNGKVHNPVICNTVLTEAGVTETENTMECTPPTTTSTKSGVCVLSKYLIIKIFEPPTMKSGLNGPTLTASNAEKLTVSVSVIPIAKVSAYNGIFSLFIAPEVKAVVIADSASTGKCSGKMEITVCGAQMHEIPCTLTANEDSTTS
jgi:hypothetical protein